MDTELARGIYWVGDAAQATTLQCNPYLLVDAGEAVLFDPGSPLDFEEVHRRVTEIVPIEAIKYVVLSHQDPDLCASLPLFEKSGLAAPLICHWRTAVIVKYYGVKSSFCDVSEADFRLELKSGRTMEFIHTPYLHFPGAIMTYDAQSRILFSGDLFGGFSSHWSLFADEDYVGAMEAFHETYMPSNSILRPIMERLRPMSISTIAPQHGSIINSDVQRYIDCLENLECGVLLSPVKRALDSTGGYVGLCNSVLKRCFALFEPDEVRSVFAGTSIVLDDHRRAIRGFEGQGHELWDQFFETIYSKRGMPWINMLQTLIKKLIGEYDVPMPQILVSTAVRKDREIQSLSEENRRIRELNIQLKNSLETTRDKITRDPITGLHNEQFLRQYVVANTKRSTEQGDDFALLLIELDNFSQIVYEHTDRVGNEALKSVTSTIQRSMPQTHLLFKLKGGEFGYFMPETVSADPVETAEHIRLQLAQSESFIEKVTATIGVATGAEFFDQGLSHDELLRRLGHMCRARLRYGKSQGMNRVCSTSSIGDDTISASSILVVDTDEASLSVLTAVLRRSGYSVTTRQDGLAALSAIQQLEPDLVVCELMIPKLDGFALRKSMLQSSIYKDIPYVLLSHQRDEDLVARAFDLGIEHFLKKPYMLAELLGVIRVHL